MKQNLEIEVKFFLEDVFPVKKAILELGGVSFGRFFELNLRFDDEQNSLFKKKSLLRLRKDQKTWLRLYLDLHLQLNIYLHNSDSFSLHP